jgi:hypothetical protein
MPIVDIEGAAAPVGLMGTAFKTGPRSTRRRPTDDELTELEMTMIPMIPPPGFTVGCDPEVFIVNAKPSAGVTAGGTDSRDEKNLIVDCGAVQVDGMAAEFNTDPPTTSRRSTRISQTVHEDLDGNAPEGQSLSSYRRSSSIPMFNNAPTRRRS